MLIRRPKRELRHGVVYEIPRTHMRPAFVFMRTTERVPLVENMVFAIIVAETVGVVDEAERHLQMKAVVPTVLKGESRCHLGIYGLFVKMLHAPAPPCYAYILLKKSWTRGVPNPLKLADKFYSSGLNSVNVRPKATAKPTTFTTM